MRIGFVTWDGPDQNYLASLFVPIFARLREFGIETDVLQFSWNDDARRIERAQVCSDHGVGYFPVSAWHTPVLPGTVASISRGVFDVQSFVRSRSIDLLVPRSLIPAAMTLGYLKLNPKIPVCFDADGLMADERAEFASGHTGPSYHVLRAVEAQMVRESQSVITRTSRAVEILKARGGTGVAGSKFWVVSNAKDSRSFAPRSPEQNNELRQRLGIDDGAFVVVYAGSVGPQYYPKQMIRFVELLSRDRAVHFVVLTGTPNLVGADLRRSGVPFTLKTVAAAEVPSYLAAADLGLAFRTSSFSQSAVAPIKVGEYLLCGTPVVSTTGIGDLDSILDDEVGFLLDTVDDGELERCVQWIREANEDEWNALGMNARKRGLAHFSVDVAMDSYVSALKFAVSENI